MVKTQDTENIRKRKRKNEEEKKRKKVIRDALLE